MTRARGGHRPGNATDTANGSFIRMSKTRISHPAAPANKGGAATPGRGTARRPMPSRTGNAGTGAARPVFARTAAPASTHAHCEEVVVGERRDDACPHGDGPQPGRSSTGPVRPGSVGGQGETHRMGGMQRSMGMHRTRVARAMVALAALLWSAGAVASGATSQREVNPGGGAMADGSDGLRWQLGSNSQFQVYLGGSGQVYNPPSTPASGSLFNSVYLRVDRGTDATTRLYNNSNYGLSSGLHANALLPFTQVSQSAISGSGTAASPWQVTTVLRPSDPADDGITVTIVDRYVGPESWLTRRVTLSGMPASGASIKFYQHVDTYLQGGDNGPGFARTSAWNATGIPDVVGVIKGQQFQALWYEPSSGTPHWNRYSSELFTYPVFQMCRGVSTQSANPCTTGTGDLSNTVNPSTTQDHGMAAQWNVPAGASAFTVEYRITFAMNPVDLTKSFAPTTISAGDTSTLTFNLSNRSTNPVDSIGFTDTLPAAVKIAATPNIRTNCPAGGTLGGSLPSGMTVTAAPGSSVIQIAGAGVSGAASAGSQRVCQVTVDVTSSVAGQHHNTNANISGTLNLVNLVGDEVLTVLQPQLEVAKAVVGTLVAGQGGGSGDGHYTITITNGGTGALHLPVQINDALPAGFTATAAGSAQGAVDCGTLPGAGPLACTFTPSSPIPVGDAATIRLDVAIASGTSGSATNVVGVAGGGDPDPMPSCPAPGDPQCAEATAPLALNADLRVEKTNNDGGMLLGGQQTTYRIVVANDGPSDAHHSVVQDPIPAGLACSSVTCGEAAGGAACPAPASVTVAALSGAGIVIDTLPATGSVAFTLTCTVADP